MKPYFSLLSIIFAVMICLLKISLDIQMFNMMKKAIEASNGDISPSLVAIGGMKATFFYVVIFLIPAILCFFGWKEKGNYYKIALVVNVFTLFYTLIPVGTILAWVLL